MGRINDLIKEMCPNGVEFKKLEDCCNILDNKRKPISKGIREMGEYPYYGANGIQDYISDYIFDGKYVLVGEDGSVQTPNGTPIVNWAIGKIWVNNHAHIIEEIDGVSLRYLYHYLQIVDVKDLIHGNIPKLNQSNFRNIKIAVPPLEVQEEIVKILDKFSELEAELEAKLEAELEARKSQYEFWRGNLFEIKDAKEVRLDELFNLKNGFTPSKSNSEFWKNGTIPWFRMEDIRENGRILDDSIQHVTVEATKGNIMPANSIIISTSATIGEHALITCKSLSNQRFTYLMLKDEYKNFVDMKYIFYHCFLLDKYCLGNLNQGNFSSIDMNAFKKYIFKIPSLEKQKKIVSILNRFDDLTSNITIGLSAEIELRRKQYEYYKNKLLSFEELKNE